MLSSRYVPLFPSFLPFSPTYLYLPVKPHLSSPLRLRPRTPHTSQLSLPTLSPTTLPPVLSLLSLRAELGAVANTWTSARRTVECLEFVRRRWGVYEEHSVPANANLNANANAAREGLGSSSSTGTSSNATSTAPPPSRRPNVEPRWKPSDSSELVCAICFEGVNTNPNTKTDSSADPVDQSAQNPSPNPNPTRETMRGRCRLDCGHELHATCLVAWLHHQAFCPTCHLALSASPPAAPAARPSVVTSPAPASPVSGMHGRTETLRRRAGSVTTASASANATAITAAAVTEDEGEGEDERGVPSYIF